MNIWINHSSELSKNNQLFVAVCSHWVLFPKKNASFLISLIVVILRVTKISVNNIRMIWNEQASTVWRTYHTYNHLIFSSLWGLSAYRIHIRTRNCPNCNLHSLVLIHSDCKILYIFNRSTQKKTPLRHGRYLSEWQFQSYCTCTIGTHSPRHPFVPQANWICITIICLFVNFEFIVKRK